MNLDSILPSALASKSRLRNSITIAVVGAGVSGAIAARTLVDHGLSVHVFEKSRGVGGRMATRRYDGFEFDHGAQYFTARHPVFGRYLRSWEQQRIVECWDGQIVAFDGNSGDSGANWECRPTPVMDRYVATSRMPDLCKHLLRQVNVTLEATVATVKQDGDGYRLMDSAGVELGKFDCVILAIPAPQAIPLAVDYPEMTSELAKITFDPCWCGMYHFERAFDVPWQGAFVNGGAIRWLSRNTSKPGRQSSGESIVVHASPDWSLEHFEKPAELVASLLLDELWRIVRIDQQIPVFMTAHRWRYSIPSKGVEGCLTNRARTMIACGDWARGSRVEGAFLSGYSAAGIVLGTTEHP